MNKLSLGLAAMCWAVTGAVSAADDATTMPQTRGMQGMDPKFHDPANKPTVNCTPKAGMEHMAHAPEGHPMPETKGMKGMDPAQHMEDCVSSDALSPPKSGQHQHKTPGSGG
ncbi:MAG: hypothetical protein WC809_21575 [Sinimarinibacterium sp.]|jgi:hypothetical protein